MLGLIVLLSSIFFLHNLGNQNITLWDEAVHVNVVSNLANDCCVPKLHLRDLGSDYRDWTDNHIWLHKPLLPFYINAGFYAIFGGSLFAFRLPNYLFAELTAVILFLIGWKHWNRTVALLAAALFAANGYLFELVQGRQFSGLSDILACFFLCLALLWILRVHHDETLRGPFILGGLVGLAYLCKGGLAFAPLAVWGWIGLGKGLRRGLLHLSLAALVAALIVMPERLLLTQLFPVESRFEAKAQVMHLFSDVEFWGRPWDYYFSHYFKVMLGPLLVLIGYLGVARGLSRWRTPESFIPALWVLSYMLPLSLGVSKVSNFIFPCLPALCLLISSTICELRQKNRHRMLSSLAFSVIATFLITRLDLFHSSGFLNGVKTPFQRFGILILQILLFTAASFMFAYVPHKAWKHACLALGSMALCIYGWATLGGNWVRASTNLNHPGLQKEIRESGAALKPRLPAGSILIIDSATFKYSRLYFQYWSGFDAVNVSEDHPLGDLYESMRSRSRNVYLISAERVPNVSLVREIPFGYVYSLAP